MTKTRIFSLNEKELITNNKSLVKKLIQEGKEVFFSGIHKEGLDTACGKVIKVDHKSYFFTKIKVDLDNLQKLRFNNF